MNNVAGTASVTFNSGVMNAPLTSLVPIEYVKNVWLGNMFAQINASDTPGVQPLPTSTYIYAYPTFAFASGGGSFLGKMERLELLISYFSLDLPPMHVPHSPASLHVPHRRLIDLHRQSPATAAQTVPCKEVSMVRGSDDALRFDHVISV
jgi:hypothetical protein